MRIRRKKKLKCYACSRIYEPRSSIARRNIEIYKNISKSKIISDVIKIDVCPRCYERISKIINRTKYYGELDARNKKSDKHKERKDYVRVGDDVYSKLKEDHKKAEMGDDPFGELS